MNWDAIGAIGEIIGAIAVVATLLYLAVQTKSARTALEAGGTLSTAELFSRWRTAFVQSPDLASVFAKANAGEELREDEKLKLSLFSEEIFFCVTASYLTISHTGAVHSDSAEINNLASLIERMPALETEWERMHEQIEAQAPILVAAVDKILEARE